MIPNKTNEQILYQHFKFFDLDSTGYCSLQNFIRVQNRIGVVLPKVNDFEIIFNYFSEPETILLNYKNFCKDIFNFDLFKKIQKENDTNNLDEEIDFISILIKQLMSKSGPFTLLELIKNLQIIDFEGNKRISSDELLIALQRCGIKLETKEIQTLFIGYDFFKNGVINYQILIDMLLTQFWDEKKIYLGEQIFMNLTNEGRNQINLNDLKYYFDKILEDSPDKNNFLDFIDKYKIINKNRNNLNLILPDMIKLLQFYQFGDKSYSFLENLLNILVSDIKKNDNEKYSNINNFDNNLERKNKISYNNIKEMNQNTQLRNIFEQLREKIINYSRKTFFNFIKHFKYYDENFNDITIYNFSKVLKDFNINLPIKDIEKIFNIYEFNKKNKSMNYKDFINDLISEFTNEKRLKGIGYIYETIEERGNKFNRDIDLTFLKEVYNSKNNYFKKDETENRLEFEDCLELFHYIYKGKKNEIFNKNDFIEFYKCISFLIDSDSDFIRLISQEWRVPFEYIQNHLLEEYKKDFENKYNNDEGLVNNNIKDGIQKNYQINKKNVITGKIQNNKDNLNNYPKKSKIIEKLINNDFDNNNKENYQKSLLLMNNILKNRGLRGILYLHLEFINSCQDLSKISLDDFINVIEIQHINLSEIDCKNIFNQFALKNNNNYLDFSSLIRNFKIELNENKLSSVEQAFNSLDINGNDRVPLSIIKKKYKANNHPDVLNGAKNEDELILEFLDCFNINYEILSLDSKSQTSNNSQNMVDFEIFANFYEYVAFIYQNDKEFDNIVRFSWK